MPLDTGIRSRRALLGAALGATVANVVVRPAQVLAGTDGDVVLGAENTSNSSTVIRSGSLDGAIVGVNEGGPGLVGSNTSIGGVGIRAWGDSIGLQAEVPGPPGAAVWAKAGWGDGGQGTAIRADGWVAITGKVSMSRSGRVTVARGRLYADVDLRAKGGLDHTPLCFANVMSYRPGVFVTMVRPNYPVEGKVRIYLNRAPTASTYVAWLVLD